MKRNTKALRREEKKIAKTISYQACDDSQVEQLVTRPVDNLALLASLDPAFAKIYEARKADK